MKLIDEIKEIAFEAGSIALAESNLSSSNAIPYDSKSSEADIVTATDKKTEAFIIERVSKLLPGSAILGEENGFRGSRDAEFMWIIDPIDGTANFAHKLHMWAGSIALWRNNAPYIGVVYAPVLGEMYCAEAGCGAYLNGRKISVSKVSEIKRAAAGTGFACLRAGWQQENNLKFFNRIAPLAQNTHRFGSASIDMCLVASGRLDFLWEIYLQPYDQAAAHIIVTEAGGTVSDLYGGSDTPAKGTLASNTLLHSKVLEFFSDYQALCK
jgi:myo-inositol-1(or 4)-monophosphatase